MTDAPLTPEKVLPLADQREREKAARVAIALEQAFQWEETPQGRPYWRKIYRELLAMAGDEA